MSICTHETSCTSVNNKDGYCGYMQFYYDYADDYCYGIYYKDTIKIIMTTMCNQGKISQNDFKLLQSNSTNRSTKESILINSFVSITFGTSALYQHCFDKKDIWKGLCSYCGDPNSPIEDCYYRNTLAKLIDEELIYEDKYKNHAKFDDYSIIVNNAVIKL